MFIRVIIDYEENTTVVKKENTINFSIIKKILF